MSRSGLNMTQPSFVFFELLQHHVEQNLQLLSSLVYFLSPVLGSMIGVASPAASFSPERLLGWDFSDQPHRHDRHATRVSPARGQNRCCKGAEASPDLSTAVRSGRKRAVAPRAALSSFCAGAAEAPPVTGGPARWLGRDTELAAAAVTGSCAAAAASAKLWTTMIDCPALHMC